MSDRAGRFRSHRKSGVRSCSLPTLSKSIFQALGREGVKSRLVELRRDSCLVLVEKIEAIEDFEFCEELGLRPVSGTFSVSSSCSSVRRAIPGVQIGVVRLLSEDAGSYSRFRRD